MQKEIEIDRKKLVRRVILVLLIILLLILIKRVIYRRIESEEELASSSQTNMIIRDENRPTDKITIIMKNEEGPSEIDKKEDEKKETKLDWNLLLVNTDNKMPDDYYVQLENIDQSRSFDKRAIQNLTNMLSAIRNAGIFDIWIQSAYRTPEAQQKLFEDQVQAYIYQGYDERTARELTEKIINKPWHSEHNLGLAVDFNYVNREFENTAAFQWLQENAQDYGFILRYAEEKENITKVSYEPWHWRYVGEEHAKKMKSRNLCLEEYIEQITK